ncbi:MAG: hypothetical protein Q4C84_13500 [Bacillota bacterium]|nr:hypothetical protein [Bacillota bacterium]
MERTFINYRKIPYFIIRFFWGGFGGRLGGKASPKSSPKFERKLVYIGVDGYEILSISEDMVRLRNQKYPIFTEEMPREEFERKLRENPANDFLKKGKAPEEISLQEPDLPAEKETAQDLSPAWEKATPRKTDSFDLHPEIPQSQ